MTFVEALSFLIMPLGGLIIAAGALWFTRKTRH